MGFQSHIDTALERLPDGGTPRPFNIVNAWEKYKPRDMKLCAGFVPIKPSGCHFETVRRIRTGFKQPFLHRDFRFGFDKRGNRLPEHLDGDLQASLEEATGRRGASKLAQWADR